MKEVVSVITMSVNKISDSEFKENNTAIAVDAHIIVPKLSFGDHKELTPDLKDEFFEKIRAAQNLPKIEDESFEPKLNTLLNCATLKSTGKMYVRYDGYAPNLIGLIRVTSYGKVGEDFLTDGLPIEFNNKVEKYINGAWVPI